MTNTHTTTLVSQLQRWEKDRGALAALRGGLRAGSPMEQRAWPLLAELCSLDSPEMPCTRMVAGLWATDPKSHNPKVGNFGSTCRLLAEDYTSFDERFRRLVSSTSQADLCTHVVRIALAAQAKGIQIDYNELFEDIKSFVGQGREQLRIKWAAQYWVATATP